MNQISLKVTGNHLETVSDVISTQGSVNYDSCLFSFDEEWTSLTKTAVFAFGNSDSLRVAIENNTCTIPSSCMEKDGIIRIGVYGIKDGQMIVTTNSVAHHVYEGLTEIGEWMEEDNSLVIDAIKKLDDYALDYKASLDKKFSELKNQIVESGVQLPSNVPSSLPEDWYTPPEFTDAANCPMVTTGAVYEDFLDYMLNTLLSDFPDYVSRQEIGKSSDNSLPVYTYTFAPENYEKTMIISTYVHGHDRIAFFSLCYFLDRLCKEYSDSSKLSYIHNSIKLIVVPVANPYALNSGTAYNVNRVNIGYNFPYNWEACQYSYKGSTAADQTETQSLINLLENTVSDKLCALIDLHVSSLTVSGRAAFYTRAHRNCATELSDVINCLNYDAQSTDLKSKAILSPSSNPTFSNYAAEIYNINTCELVWSPSVYSGVFSNECITKYTEFIANTAYTMSKCSRYPLIDYPSPFIRHLSWSKSSDDDVFTISSSDWEKLNISSYKMALKYPCNIALNGYVNIKITTECTVEINPTLYQINSPEQEYSDRINSNAFVQSLTLGIGSHSIPIASVLQAYFTSYNNSEDCMYCEDVGFVLNFKSSVSGAAAVTAYSATLNLTPSDTAHPVEISRPMGNVSDYTGDEIPTQSLIYPLGTYSNTDSFFND